MNRKLANLMAVFLAWYFCCGCVTKRLWEEKAFNEPSPQPNLQLYYSEAKHDVLVVYDELHERSSSVIRRGYYLNGHRSNVGKPLFIDRPATNQLQQIPMFVKTNAEILHVNTNIYAVLGEPATFSLTVNGVQKGPYELPVYPSDFHQGTQIALTPLAVIADTVIIASVAGAIVAYMYASGYHR
ncbi:MAG: hypothetical protein JWO95_2313 [Verrucomicrobiales bacterium]|nr:hypothetical protein [Verrucomicrobiales bacterium]